MSIVAIVPGEEELGPQRLCLDCRCWWPDTAEYFAPWGDWQHRRCRACETARRAATALRQRLEAAAAAQEAQRAVWRRQQASWRARASASARNVGAP